MPRQTILLNTHNFAASQFFNHSANSAVMFGGKLLFATSDGLYESGGDNDGYIDVAGVPTPVQIDAHIMLPVHNFGYQGQKSPRSMLLGGKFDGQMHVSITDEKGVTQNYVSPEMEDADGTKLALRTDQRSRYFTTKISNVDGSDFSLESADLVFIPGPERRR